MMIVHSFLLIALVAVPWVANAEQARQARVTLAFCGDLNAEKVQEVIAVENQRVESMSIACHGDAATVRVTGPTHPDRILEIELAGVPPVAQPRTIAVVATEAWTSSAEGLALAPNEDELPTGSRHTSHGDGPRIGLSFALSSRSLQETSDTSGFVGKLPLWTLEADVPVGRLRVYGSLGASPSSAVATAEGLTQLSWRREELGIYLPLRMASLQVNLRLGTGSDRLRTDSAHLRHLPRYSYTSYGVDADLDVDRRTRLRLRWAVHDADDATTMSSPMGVTWRLGLAFAINRHLRLDVFGESLDYNNGDELTTFSLGLSLVN